MKTPIGASSRSVNPYQSLKDAIIRGAQRDYPGIESSRNQMRDDRRDRRSDEWMGRSEDELADAIQSRSNVFAGPTARSVDGKREFVTAAPAREEIIAAIKRDRKGMARTMAESEGPGLLERVRQMQLYANEQLQAKGARGHVARAGVVTAATGGVTMGLTAAGQGLMALMEYMQNGGQQEEARENPLS